MFQLNKLVPELPSNIEKVILPSYPRVGEKHDDVKEAQTRVEIANEARGKNQRVVRVTKPNEAGRRGKVKMICPLGSCSYPKGSRWHGPCAFTWVARSRAPTDDRPNVHWETIEMTEHSPDCTWSKSTAKRGTRKSALSIVARTFPKPEELVMPQYPKKGEKFSDLEAVKLRMQVANDARRKNQRIMRVAKPTAAGTGGYFIAICPDGCSDFAAGSKWHGSCAFRVNAKSRAAVPTSSDPIEKDNHWEITLSRPHSCNWVPKGRCRKRAVTRKVAKIIDDSNIDTFSRQVAFAGSALLSAATMTASARPTKKRKTAARSSSAPPGSP